MGAGEVRGVRRQHDGLDPADRAHHVLVHPEIGPHGPEAPGLPQDRLREEGAGQFLRLERVRPPRPRCGSRVQGPLPSLSFSSGRFQGGRGHPRSPLSSHQVGVQSDLRFQPLPVRDRPDPSGDQRADRPPQGPGRCEGAQRGHLRLHRPGGAAQVPAALGQDPQGAQDHGPGAFPDGRRHDVPCRPGCRSIGQAGLQRLLQRPFPRPPGGADQGCHISHQGERQRAGPDPGGVRARAGGVHHHAPPEGGVEGRVQDDGLRPVLGP